MPIRDTIQKNGIWIAAGGLILAAVLFYYVAGSRAYHPPQSAFFVDEETGEESIRPLTDIPPLVGKSGKETIVRVVKVSDDGGKTAKVAYYFKYNDATKKRLESAVASGSNIAAIDGTPGELVRDPAPGSKWVSIGSDDGQQISHIDIPQGKDIMMVFP